MKKIIWTRIESESIIFYLQETKKFWTPIPYKEKNYIMTFDNNVFEVLL
jgi:hypothetical protein